ncbi:glycosyl transferase [Thioalkalivibrio denitrificans]|uniref:Glycosyl transferase n=1 Tax=Thioalkalivibrio denitrificans TaxID=108003 RepID=A0A1V3NDQ9_9GAMM|nr:glycosyltransferase [Thioalkalivibrio denitrificans]OOG23012.1 glycosyl transferase [Thioalkalivibrio denitrificans]
MTAPERERRVAIFGAFKAWGGIESTVTVLAEEFLRHRVRPIFVLLRGGAFPYPDRMPEAVGQVDLQTRGKWHAIPCIIRYLRRERPDAVLTVDAHSAEAVMLARWLGRIDTPVYLKATNTLSQAVRRPNRQRLIRWLYPRANGVIAVSRGVAEDLCEHFAIPRELVHVIYNPMFTSDMPERLAQPVDHPWLQEGADTPVILGVGRLCHQKAFDDLIRALARLRERRPARLLILGEGGDRAALEQLADELGMAEHVSLPGFVPDPLPYMARAAVFALSSRYEGLGNVIIEALAAGARVVSTDCPSGPAEILDGGRYGTLVPVGDIEAMADALDHALSSPPDHDAIEAAQRFHSGSAARYLEVMKLL